MKKLLPFLFALALAAGLFVQNANAQIAVTVSGSAVTTPALAAGYTSLANAVTALNAVTAYPTPGTIVFTCAASASETTPPNGLTIGSATLNPLLSATNTVTIIKSSGTVTLNAGVGTSTPGSAAPDGILKIVGADYITIDGLTFTDGNTTNPATMEFGICLFKYSLSDGASYNTIQNCTFNMQRINNASGSGPMVDGSVGVNVVNSIPTAATTQLTPTTAAGTNSYNKFYANTFNGGNYGIALNGFAAATPFTAGDTGNDIGGTSISTGNTILNFGGGAAANPAAGIRANNQWGINISYNIINNNNGSGVNHATTLRGIYAQAGTSASTTINYNTITVKSGATTSALTAIENAIGSTATTNTISINNNIIQNCAYSTATTGTLIGILNSATPNILNINNNIIRGNSSATTTGNFTGISNTAAVVTTCNINGNQIGDGTAGAITLSAITSATVYGISCTGGATTCNLSINSNNFQGFSYGLAGTGAFRCINLTATVLTENINTNNFNNLTVNTSASVVGFLINSTNNTPTVTINGNYITTQFTNTTATGGANFIAIANGAGTPAAGSTTITNNILSNATFKTTTGFGAMIYWSSGSGTSCTHNIAVNLNTISNISNTGVGAAAQAAGLYGILVSLGSANVISNNDISFLTAAGGTSIGIFAATASTNLATIFTVNNNNIHDIKSTSVYGTAAGGAQGMQIQAGPAGNNIYKNKIYNVSCVTSSAYTAGTAAGMYIAQGNAGSTTNIYNNYVGRVYSVNSTYYQAVVGIFFVNSVVNTTNLYYNTINLDGTAGGQTYCFYKGSATSNINLRNNIFVNNCVGGNGDKQMVYFFTGALGATYLATSNNNLLYCGTPGPLNLIYADGAVNALTNMQQTLVAFQSFVAPTRETGSRTEAVPFLNTTTGSGSDYLHISPAVQTLAESGAVNIATYTDDYDGNVRQGNPGYPVQVNGGGIAPDMGADEFDGMPFPLCSGTPAASTITGDANICSGTGTSLALSTTYTGVGNMYQWASSTTRGGPYNTALGTLSIQATGNLTATTYYICTITCTFGGLFYTTAEKAVVVIPLPGAVPSSNSPLCAGTTLNLTGTSADGTSFSWSGPNGFTSTSQNPGISSATIAATGTYFFTATANGCSSAVSKTDVTVNDSPSSVTATASKNEACEGTPFNLSSSSVTALAYIAPFGDGGFETGSTFALNNWTVINGTYNAWSVGNAAGVLGGANAAYAGTNFTGTPNASVNHFYRDVVVPSAATNIILKFYLKMPVTDNTYDYLYVYTTTTARIPVAGTTPGAGYTMVFSNTATAYDVYSMQTVVLPNSLAGTTVRLVFTYKCDVYTPCALPAVDNITFLASVTGAATYSWSSVPVGFTSTAQNPAGVTQSTATQYIVTAQNSFGCAGTATTTVNNISGAQISVQPVPAAKCEGEAVAFEVTAAGSGLTYQWRKNSSDINTVTNPSAATAHLSLASVSTADAGNYDVVVGASCGNNIFSNAVALTVLSGAQISVQPVPATKCEGQAVVFEVAATGSGLTYQWRQNGSDINTATNPSAATATLSLASSSAADAGNYDVMIGASCGNNIFSNAVALTVNPVPVVSASGNTPVCSGLPIHLFGTSDIVTGTSYNWSGPDGFTSTDKNPDILSATQASSGTYSFTATATGCSSTAATTDVTVNMTPPAVTIAPESVTMPAGKIQQLAASCGTGSVIFTWLPTDDLYTDAGATVAYDGTGNMPTVYTKPTASRIYTATAATAAGCANSTTVAVTALCPETVAPFCEDFEGTIFPPDCWTNAAVSGPSLWERSDAASGYGTGTGSAFANFYNQESGTYELASMSFSVGSLASRLLKFDFAYAAFGSEYTDEMDVYYSTDYGLTWKTLLLMPGGPGGILNPQHIVTTDPFVPSASQWNTETLALPAGTNMLKFKAISGWGNNLYVDNITVTGKPPVVITNAAADVVSTGANLHGTVDASFQSTAVTFEFGMTNSYGITYVAVPGTVTGHTATAVNYAVSGLTSNTTYHYRVVGVNAAGTSHGADMSFTTPAGIPYDNTVQDVTVSDDACYDATNFIVVAGGATIFQVTPTGFASFIAGVKINFLPGTKVDNGGYLIGKISTGTYCGGKIPSLPEEKTTQEEVIPVSFEQANFTLYPNPTTGNFALVQKGDKAYGTLKLDVFSMNGEMVLSDRMTGEKIHEFRFSDVPVGLYFVKIVADDYVETIKLVKTR